MNTTNRSIGIVIGFLALLLTCSSLKAQTSNITIEASQNITNFSFIDSDGVKDKNYSPNFSGGYALGYRYTMEMGLFFGGKLGMRKAGATYVVDESNYSWNLQYMDARLGIGYNFAFGKMGAHFYAQPYLGYLLKANQSLNNENFDIINSESMSRIDYGVFFSPGVNLTASDFISIYVDLNYMLGLANLETTETQTSKNNLFGATLGVAFAIK